jgi:simple sugar transport system permease protein
MPEKTLTPATESAVPERERPRVRLARLRDFALIPAIIVIAVIGQIVNPIFLQSDNLINILQTMSEMSLLVMAQTLVLVAGKMDLSLESTFGLAPGVAAWLTVAVGSGAGLGVLSGAWAIPVTLAVGALIGAINALLIVRFGLNGFIVTLGMLIVLRGLLTGLSGGQTFFNLPPSMLYLGSALWFGVPASIWLCLLLFAVGIVLLGFTRYGRALYAIGGNVDAAKAAGIRTDRVLWTVLVGASLLAALGGLLMSGHLASVAAAQGDGAIFTVFAAAVIGGIDLDGGRGRIAGAATGVILLGVVQNILLVSQVPSYWVSAIYGGIILLSLMLGAATGSAQLDRLFAHLRRSEKRLQNQ